MSARPSAASLFRAGWPLALLAAAVLAVGIGYTAVYILGVPYPGVSFDGEWRVVSFDSPCDEYPNLCLQTGTELQPGDRLLQIGDLTYEPYARGMSPVPFSGFGVGKWVPIRAERDGIEFETSWRILGPSSAVQFQRFLTFLIFLPFWIAGSAVLLFLRPHDPPWAALIAFNYATALWIATGILSSHRVAGSAIVLRIACLFMPAVYLHLHTLVPAPRFGRARPYLIAGLYALGAILGVVGLTTALPSSVYNIAMLLAISGSIGLLLHGLVAQTAPHVRLAVRLMLTGIALSFGPGLVLWVIPTLTSSRIAYQSTSVVMLAAISLLPLFYVYALYKHRMGNLEFRANRFLSLFAFLAVFITLFLFVFVVCTQLNLVTLSPAQLAFALIISVVFATAGLFARPPFQRLIDRLAYGTEHNPDDIIRAFANQIPVALNREALVDLLTHEVAPSLLIRQSALYLVGDAHVTLLYADRVAVLGGPHTVESIHALLAGSGNYRPAERDDSGPFAWVRLAVAIEVGRVPIGVWLLGRRDPDDYYPRPDIALLTTLANQIGVALENASLFENLQRRAAELERAYHELQDLDRMKDEFVQNVSHELRTPLTIIQTSSELLLEGIVGDLNKEQMTIMERLVERTHGMTRLVNDILALQQASLERIERKPVNLRALAQACLQGAELMAQQPEYQGRRYRFVLQAADDLPHVTGDRNRLRQVLDNLVGNAMKFSPNGGTIAIAMHTCDALPDNGRLRSTGQPAVEITVNDEGIGIPASELERIWRRFYQVDGSSTRSFGGTGLGLAIARGIVNAHGGAIWAESVLGVGSTFRCILPVEAALPVAAPPAILGAPGSL